MQLEITNTEKLEFAGLCSTDGATHVHMTAFNSGRAHINVSVSTVEFCIAMTAAELREFAAAMNRTADAAKLADQQAAA